MVVSADRLLFTSFDDKLRKCEIATANDELFQNRPIKGRVMHFMDEWQHGMFARMLFLLLGLRQKHAFSITKAVWVPNWIYYVHFFFF